MDPLPSASKHSPAPESENDALPCFAVPTGHELTSGGRKVIGGAQKWSRRGFLQHGSILLNIDTALWANVVGHEAANELHAVGVNELLEPSMSASELMKSLAVEFERAMGGPATVRYLSPFEKESAVGLADTKYSNRDWNVFRRDLARRTDLDKAV